MKGNYTIGAVRKMTILNELRNPVDGYEISFSWSDDHGRVRNSSIKVEEAGASKESVDTLIKAEIAKIESWQPK
jgi:hypothetical protein